MNGRQPMIEARSAEPSIGALLGSLVSETGTLVRQEIHLASTEMGQKAKSAVHDLGMVEVGGALAHAGLLALIAAVVIGLGTIVPMWISALVIGVLALVGGYALIRRGVSALHEIDPMPRIAAKTLGDDGAFVKEQVR